ncbi:MAG TPA: hypothetical protein VLM18_03900 [Croceibacterium sp.]|nr:hypothetical protein [Croceibacterium sp.]
MFFAFWLPEMAKARRTEAFKKLATDGGYVKLWRETGDWPDVCHPTSKTDFACT